MYLLDTCTFIWLTSAPENLSSKANKLLSSESSVAISHVNVLEIVLKWSSGKLTLPTTPRIWLKEQINIWKLEELDLKKEHILTVSEIPLAHRDPFDRLLVAQAICEDLIIISPDKIFKSYPVAVEW
jgi:PIN domain nuclease of toxin-antitoxin system